MATIEISASRAGTITDLFSSMKSCISDLKISSDQLKINSLLIDSGICNNEVLNRNIQIVSDRQQSEIDSIDSLITETDEFFDTVVSVDDNVADEINTSKDDFYEQYSYLKPDCEKGRLERTLEDIGDGLASIGEWCADHWEAITVVLAIVGTIVLAVLAVVTFGAAAVLLVAAVGALVGVVSQLIGDLINLAITGDWDSNIFTYLGAALGGAVGGMLTLMTGNPLIACSVDSFVSTMFTNSAENLAGLENHSFLGTLGEASFSAALSAVLSIGFDKLSGKLSKKLANINFFRRLAGRGSYAASFNMVLTKLKNHTIKNFTVKTLRNGVISELAGGFLGNIANGAIDGIKERIQEAFSEQPAY